MARPARQVFVCSQNRPPGHPRGSCGQSGGAEVADEFIKQLQQRQCFAQVAVTLTGCLGPCGTGPGAIVYPEGVMYGGLTRADVAEIFEQHLLGGTPVERLVVPAEIW